MGRSALAVPATAKTLVLSAINFATVEVDISGGKATIGTIVLQPAGKSLSEVVVVAYGTQNKTNVTGSVATVSRNVVADKPFTSVDKALQGVVPGMRVSSTSGSALWFGYGYYRHPQHRVHQCQRQSFMGDRRGHRYLG